MSVRKSLFWSYGGQAVIFVVTFGSSVAVARVLGPREMGIFAIAMAINGVLALLSAFGVAPYLVRHHDPDADTIAAVFTVNALLNVLVSLALVVVVSVGPWFELDAKVRHVLMLLAVVPLISIFDFLPSTFLARAMNFRALSLINIGRSIVTSVTVVGCALAGFGALSPAIGIVVAGLYSVAVFNVVGRRHASVRLGLHGWRDITRFGFQMMSIGGVSSIAQRLSEIVLGHVLGLSALGIYGRASGLASQVWDNVYGLATRVIFAQMAEEHRNTGNIARTFLGGLAMLTALIWPLLMGLATLSGPLIRLLYGERWLDAATPLAILMIAHLIALGFGMNWELCVLTKRTGWQARIESVRAVVGLGAFSAGAFFGLAAAAAGRVVESLTGLVLYGPHMRQMAGTRDGEIAAVYRQSTLLTVAAVAPSVAVMASHGWSPATPLWAVGGAVALGIALWGLTLRGLRHPLAGEIVHLVSRVSARFRPAGRDATG